MVDSKSPAVQLFILYRIDKLTYMIDLRRLEILRELARCGTVAATAEAVHLTPSAVSQQLASLSREVGTAMIEPDGRRVRLTAAAELLLRHAHEIFTHLEHAESDLAKFRDGDAGTVRLGAFATAIRGLAAPMLSMLERRSGLRVEILQVDPEETADSLLARKVDVALTLTAGPSVIGADDPRLESWHVIDDVLDVVLPLDHPLAGDDEIHLADLAADDWILGMTGSSCWIVAHDACARAGFAPRTRHQAEVYTGFVALVAAGAAVGLLPRLAQGPFRNEPIVIRPIAGPPVARRIEVQYRAGTANQPHIAPVLAALREVAKSGIAPIDARTLVSN
jgi:DNA-binding transcriptional LysR family regulator